MNEDFIEVKEQLIDMYNFNKQIKVELKPLGAKAILDYIDSKDKEIERLNNVIDELEKRLENVFNEMKEKIVEIKGRGYYYTDLIPIEVVLNDLKKMKEGK